MKLGTMSATALLTLCMASWAVAQDADGDGANNDVDAFPCDASLAGQIFAPAQGQTALLLFEDQWPNWGDLDTNDVVVAYNVVQDVDGAGRVSRLQMTLDVLALGGVFDNGLGLHLPVPTSAATSVTLQTGSGAPVPVSPSISDGELTVTLQNSLRTLFGGQADQINSRPDLPRQAGLQMIVEVTFATPVALSSAEAPYDLYIFRSGDPTHEIHRSTYAGTSAMNAGLFNTLGDNSGGGRWFVDVDGIPAAILLPEAAAYPKEAVPIHSLYPSILPWAQSGGVTNADFFVTNVVTTAGYLDVQGQGALTPVVPATPPADTACVPVVSSGGQLSAGLWHTCALLADGNISCWGGGPWGIPAVPAGVYLENKAGSIHHCGLRDDGAMVCWGAGLSPGVRPGPYATIGSSWHSACGVAGNGQVDCWGYGQGSFAIGLPTPLTNVASMYTTMSLSAMCGRYTNGDNFCWRGTAIFAPVDAAASDVASTRTVDCWLAADGRVACNGAFAWMPTTDEVFVDIDISNTGMCGLRPDGTVWCSAAAGATPSGTFREVVIGMSHACGVRTDGTVTCWGTSNSYGQLDVPMGLTVP